MKRIYVAGPYTNNDLNIQENNIYKAECIGKKLASRKIQVYVPHVATRDWNNVADYTYFLNLHLSVLNHWATDILLLDGWKKSNGSFIEFKKAKDWNKVIWRQSQLEELVKEVGK